MAGNVTNKTLTHLNTHPKATSNSSNSEKYSDNPETNMSPQSSADTILSSS